MTEETESNERLLSRREALQGGTAVVATTVGLDALTARAMAQSGGPTDEISGVVEDGSGVVDGATVVAVPHDESLAILEAMTDVNGEYTFDDQTLHSGENLYHVIARDGTEASPRRGVQNYPFIAAEGPAEIPDSVIHHYNPDNFTPSNWPDEIGASDIDTITGLSSDGMAFGGEGGVSGDGSDDVGQSDTMGSFGSDMDTDFAISIPIETTDDDALILGVNNSGATTHLQLFLGDPFSNGWTAGAPHLSIEDSNGDSLRELCNESINDGSSTHVMINKTGNGSGDIDYYIDDMTSAAGTSNDVNEGFSDPVNFDVDLAYFARNNSGSISNNVAAILGNIRWFESSLTQPERQDVHDSLPWT